MKRQQKQSEKTKSTEVADYRYDNTRKNIPPAKIASEGHVPSAAKITYNYSPRLRPVLRSDGGGGGAPPHSNYWRMQGNVRLQMRRYII